MFLRTVCVGLWIGAILMDQQVVWQIQQALAGTPFLHVFNFMVLSVKTNGNAGAVASIIKPLATGMFLSSIFYTLLETTITHVIESLWEKEFYGRILKKPNLSHIIKLKGENNA